MNAFKSLLLLLCIIGTCHAQEGLSLRFPGVPSPLFGMQMDIDGRISMESDVAFTEFSLSSASGSLIPGDSAGSFDQFGAGSNELIQLTSNSPVLLDASIAMAAGWNGEVRDVFFDPGRFRLPGDAYDGRRGNHHVMIDRVGNENRFRLDYGIQNLSELMLTSESGSLVPGDNPAPFDTFVSNTSELIHLTSDTPVSFEKISGRLVVSSLERFAGHRS